MAPSRRQPRTTATKQKEEVAKKGKLQKNVRQTSSKGSQPPPKSQKGKQKQGENVTSQEDKDGDKLKSNKRQGANALPPPKKQLNKTPKVKAQVKAAPVKPQSGRNKLPAQGGNTRSDHETESDEESESSEESSSDASEEEREEGSSEEAGETQKSEQSDEEETEASGTQRDSEHTAHEESDKENARSDSEEVTSAAEEKSEESRTVSSEGSEDEEIILKKKSEKPTAGQSNRRHRRTPRPSRPAPAPKSNMVKKSRAEKQAEKAEQQRAKAEKKRLEKEAKRRAKEDKKKPEKRDNVAPGKDQTRPGVGLSLKNIDAGKSKTLLTSRIKHFNKKDPPVEPGIEEEESDDDEAQEEEDDEPTLTKALKKQKPISLFKAKKKDLKDVVEPEEPRGSAQPQSLLLRKVKLKHLNNKATNELENTDVEASTSAMAGAESNKLKEGLMAQKKSMSTLHKMSGWIQKKMRRDLNFRKKLSAWTKAIGVSHWLTLRAIKQKQGTKKTTGNFLKHRMAMRVASKTGLTQRKDKSSSEVKVAEEKDGTDVEATVEDEVLGEEKEVEAKFAVVLPRMNRIGKIKTAAVAPGAPAPSTPQDNTESVGETTTSGAKPPKPGARLVLPVKPDLSILKSIKKPLVGALTAGGDVSVGVPGSSAASEGLSNHEDRGRRPVLDNGNRSSLIQTARGKLDPSLIHLTKKSPSGVTIGSGLNQTRKAESEREDAPCGNTQSLSNEETNGMVPGVCPLYEEETDREVAQLMGVGSIHTITQPEVHWAGNPRMSGDPQVCHHLMIDREGNQRFWEILLRFPGVSGPPVV